MTRWSIGGAGLPLLALILGGGVLAAGAPAGRVALRSGVVEVGGAAAREAAGGIDTLAEGELAALIVHGRGAPERLRQGLDAEGARVVSYLPDGAWLVAADGPLARRIRARAAALGADLVVPMLPAWKLAPELAEAAEGPVGIVVHLLPGADPTRAEALLAGLGPTPALASGRAHVRLATRLAPADVRPAASALAALPEVTWIERRGEVRLSNSQAVPLLQSGSSRGGSPFHAAGLRGEGQIVGYIDTGLDHDACFFADDTGQEVVTNPAATLSTDVNPDHAKIHAYNFLWTSDTASDPLDYDNHGHGTHVGGNIGGAAPSGEAAAQNGLAPAARLVVQDGGYRGVDDCADLPGLGCPVVDLTPFFAQAYTQGARIHTNSWGDNENSAAQWTYSAGSEDVDAFTREHPDFLLIFAAGNSGPKAGTVGSPSTAKNALAVGGSMNGTGAERVITFSSRGPTADGRIKPDVMAPANNTSAASDKDVETGNCGLDTGAGTSYAAPLVAGAAALVRQYLTEGWYPSGNPRASDAFTPSAALLKALLIDAGVSMRGAAPSPSFDQGWGRVLLEDTLALGVGGPGLRLVDGERAFEASGETPFTREVRVEAGAPLKVTVVWSDAPSTPLAAVNLVNDLDLEVEVGGTVYKGNVRLNGRSVPGGAADRLNNVEQVYLPAPVAGRYTVRITPRQIPVGPQPFALVIRGALGP